MVSSVGARIGGLGRAARGANTDTHAAPEETHAAARGAAGAAGWRWAWARAGARAHAHAHVRTRTRHDRLHCDVRSETKNLSNAPCPARPPDARERAAVLARTGANDAKCCHLIAGDRTRPTKINAKRRFTKDT